jgi:hypothetical protein
MVSAESEEGVALGFAWSFVFACELTSFSLPAPGQHGRNARSVMANRHSHKKLRAEVKARMARTGESYQEARRRIQAEGSRPARAPSAHYELDAFELTEFTYFGKPAMLATWTTFGTAHGAMLLTDIVRHPLLWSKPLFGRRVW